MCPSPTSSFAWLGRLGALGLFLCGGAQPACGGESPSSMAGDSAEAVPGGRPPALEAGNFFVRLDWQTPTHERLATQCASAHLWFFADVEGTRPRSPVGLDRLQVIMPCCASEPATKPRWQPAAGFAHRLDVADICPSRSGRWELRLTARFDDGTTDDSVISFVAR